MATDSKGKKVGFGDYVSVVTVTARNVEKEEAEARVIVRIVRLSESPKGSQAVGAYVDLVGNGRVAKVTFDPVVSTLVMRSDGGQP